MSKRQASQTKPNITYYAALEAAFIWLDIRYDVMTCDCTVLTAFLRFYCPEKNTETLYKALELLNDDCDLARWQALDRVMNKAELPLLIEERG